MSHPANDMTIQHRSRHGPYIWNGIGSFHGAEVAEPSFMLATASVPASRMERCVTGSRRRQKDIPNYPKNPRPNQQIGFGNQTPGSFPLREVRWFSGPTPVFRCRARAHTSLPRAQNTMKCSAVCPGRPQQVGRFSTKSGWSAPTGVSGKGRSRASISSARTIQLSAVAEFFTNSKTL